jgi:hypothetical protein
VATLLQFPLGDPDALWADYARLRDALIATITNGEMSMSLVCATADAWRRWVGAFTGERAA